MPNHDRDEVDDADDVRNDYAPAPPRPRASNTGLVVGLVVGGAVLLMLLVCGGAIAMFAMRAGPPVPGQPVATAIDEQPVPDGPMAKRMLKKGEGTRRVFTQNEFKSLVLGKSEREVIALLGPSPIMTEQPRRWTYRNCVLDPETDKAGDVTLGFEDGKVNEIQW